ncbi:MAG: hypothetical protein JST00_37535 [Deltaproteobacteria bacterium]|nr:hypothetical protein [Deltaproteobacteria bacterium]
MRSLSLARLLALVTLPIAFTACGTSVGEDEDLPDDEVAEQGISTCRLGDACKTLQLLVGRAYLNGPPPKITRPEVVATLPGTGDVVPRRFSQRTTGILELASGRITLSGNREGTAPVTIDDFLLFEVLGTDGALLGVGVASANGNDVRLAGRSITRVAGSVPWISIERGYEYAPGAIDLTPIIPKNKPFRIRTSAFDYAGVAIASDVHLQLGPELPPPPTPTVENPWDPAYCTGAPMTPERARALFQPGTSTAIVTSNVYAWMRTRHCNDLTGCTSWATAYSYPLTRFQSSGGGTGYDVTWNLSLPFTSTSLELFTFDNAFNVRLVVNRADGRYVARNRIGTAGVARGWDEDVEAPRFTANDDVRSGMESSFVGEHCFKAVFHKRVKATNPNERELVLFARY